ncbi:MAG: phosphatidylglycerol lysyltransferase domain-containing protein [Clostridiales bacterium]|jgi:hypothetical protein|nr:phosphatidylglycerol lysyltransferase domain-containing protein [Clostridiales bacterium]
MGEASRCTLCERENTETLGTIETDSAAPNSAGPAANPANLGAAQTIDAAVGVDVDSVDLSEFKAVEVSDKEAFGELFRAVNPQISDLTFSNIMMWREMIHFRTAWVDGFLILLALPRKYPPYAYAPIGDVAGNPGGFARAVEWITAFFRRNGWAPCFRCVPRDVVPALTRQFRSCRCEEDRDFFDYVYLASDLIGLRGKKFDGKRNHINKFRKLYEFEYETLTPAHIDDCLRIMYDRCVENDCDCLRGEDYACDRKPSTELLEHFGELDCKGAIVKVNGRYEAFTVGEALNRDTAVIYIEKANAEIQGLYTYINQQFCEREWQGMTYINREEDEGVPGLRKAKLSYHPERLIEKFTVTCGA